MTFRHRLRIGILGRLVPLRLRHFLLDGFGVGSVELEHVQAEVLPAETDRAEAEVEVVARRLADRRRHHHHGVGARRGLRQLGLRFRGTVGARRRVVTVAGLRWTGATG